MIEQMISHLDANAVATVIAALATAVLAGAFQLYAQSHPRIIYYFVHSSAVTLPAHAIPAVPAVNGAPAVVQVPQLALHTHVMVISNIGGKSATNVRLGHSQHVAFAMYPPLYLSFQGNEICIPTLVPKEQITITYVYEPPLLATGVHTYQKCDQCLVQYANMEPAQVAGVWTRRIRYFLFGVGSVTTMYYVLRWIYKFISTAV